MREKSQIFYEIQCCKNGESSKLAGNANWFVVENILKR